jgi:hypothetical protein
VETLASAFCSLEWNAWKTTQLPEPKSRNLPFGPILTQAHQRNPITMPIYITIWFCISSNSFIYLPTLPTHSEQDETRRPFDVVFAAVAMAAFSRRSRWWSRRQQWWNPPSLWHCVTYAWGEEGPQFPGYSWYTARPVLSRDMKRS